MNKPFFIKILKTLTFLLTFTLTFHFKYNNWILGLTYICLIAYLVLNKNQFLNIFKNKSWLNISIFFFIILFGMIYSSNIKQATNELIRALPMLLTPFLFLSTKGFYNNYKKNIMLGLVFGCLTAAIVCWLNVFITMYSSNEPFSYLFRHRHLNHQFTTAIGVHPTYLSLFVITAIAFIISEYNNSNKKQRLISIFLILIFTVFLFFLLARTLLLFYLMSIIIYTVLNKLWKIVIPFFILILSSYIIVFTVDDQYGYLKKKLYHQMPIIGSENTTNNRFQRLKATKYMFLEHPLVGVGTANSKPFRQKYYLETNDKKAFDRKLNAHNQFFEYLDLYGLIGGISYIMFFVFTFKMGWKNKDYLFLYITLLFFITNLTESTLQRTHGIVYFSIIFSFFYSKYYFYIEKDT